MKRSALFVFLLFFALSPTICSAATEVISLDGKWTIQQDANNVGKAENWFANPLTSDLKVSVPGVLQEVYPDYHGLVWCERTFQTPTNPNPNGKTLLRFWQVEYRAEVWLNGVYIGAHEGGEEEFELDATDALAPVGQDNRLTVRVLNLSDELIDGIAMWNAPRRNNTNVVSPGSGYASGGIVDSVEIMLVPETRIADLHVIPNWKTGEVEARITVENYSNETVDAVFSLTSTSCDGGEFSAPSSFSAKVAPGVSRVDGKCVVPNFKLWELNDPNLYSIIADLSFANQSDKRCATCGFRDFRFERGYFRLNGKRIYLKSSHSGSDSPVTHRVPYDPDLYRKDVISCKTMGFNMIRYIAGMPRRFQLDLCDRIGFLVYDECLAAWCYGACPERARRYREQTTGMIKRDRNHPCVVMWGLLNETIDSNLVLTAAAFLEEVRKLDPDRVIMLNSGTFDSFADGPSQQADFAIWRKGCGTVMPAAIKNESDESYKHDGTEWTAQTFFLHPGDASLEYAALKWTAPKDGQYQLNAIFKDVVYSGCSTADLHLFKSAQGSAPKELWKGYLNLNGCGKEQTASSNAENPTIDSKELNLRAGDELIIVVGIGDETGTGDSTAIDLKITSETGEVYDVCADYSHEKNPNGVWTYGWLPPGPTPDLDAFTSFDLGQERLSFGPIGRFANPGSKLWQNEMSDTHPYKMVPHTAKVIDYLRTHEKNGLPVYLSEYGIGSGVNLFRLARYYEQLNATDAADAKHYRGRLDSFMNDWNAWKLDDAFASPNDFFQQTIARMADQRRIGINAIRSNPNVIGHSVTGTHDQGISGEGLTTVFRELKAGTVDVMADVFAPLRFCNFVEPVQVRGGETVKIESVLVNEDALKPGEYPVRYVVFGPNNERLFDKTEMLIIAATQNGEVPLVQPAFETTFQVDPNVATGECKFYAEIQKGGAAAGGVERFFSFDAKTFPSVDNVNVYVWGNDADLLAKLATVNIQAKPFVAEDGTKAEPKPGDVLLIGKASDRKSDEGFAELYELIESGVNAVFLSVEVFAEGCEPRDRIVIYEDPKQMNNLPFQENGQCRVQTNWLYHKEDWVKRAPEFEGLQNGCVIDYLYYRDLIPSLTFKGQNPAPDRIISGAVSTTAWVPGGYDGGLSMAEWKLGKGRMTISTWTIQEALPTPIAERMLRNLILRASSAE